MIERVDYFATCVLQLVGADHSISMGFDEIVRCGAAGVTTNDEFVS